MKKELSAGLVVYLIKDTVPVYLLLHYQHGHWDFPKGHIEDTETKHDAALRELQEETGLVAEIIDGFEEEAISYYFQYPHSTDIVHKTVYFFIAHAHTQNVVLSHEHKDYAWLSYEQALTQLTYKNAQQLLKKVHRYLLNV